MTERSKKLLEILLSEGLVSEAQAAEVEKAQAATGAPLQEILLDKRFVDDEGLAKALALQLDIPFVRLIDQNIDPQVVKILAEETARQYKVIPVKLEGEHLYVAFVSPLNLPARDEIKLVTGYNILPMVATEKEVEQAINQYYKVEETSRQALIDMRMKELKEKKKDEKIDIEEDLGQVEDLPVVKLVNDIVNGAINVKTSDIHFEPQDPEMIVRYRVDGILHDIMTVPKHIEAAVISRVKILSNLDITERRRPQDGHIAFAKGDKKYDLRVSTLLTVAGEKVVLRILDRSSMLISLEDLGFVGQD